MSLEQIYKDDSLDIYYPEDRPPLTITVWLSFQHVLAMFGATVLAPILMGFDPNTAIFFSGISTLIFAFVVGFKVPSYLGSSFAYIGAISAVTSYSGSGANPNLAIALGGVFVSGVVYALIALVVIIIGHKWIERIIPDSVSGTIVGIIGISLAGVAISQIGESLFDVTTAFITVSVAVLWSVHAHRYFERQSGWGKFFKIFGMIPIIISGIIGYGFYHFFGDFYGAKAIDFSIVSSAPLFGVPQFTSPEFQLNAVIAVIPVVIVLLAENLGHVKAIGAMMKRDLNQYIGKTFLGDALATMLSSYFGGPGVTTYAENMAAMRLSHNFSVITFIGAAMFAIILGFSPKFGAIIQTIPLPVLGGLSLVLFGLITAAAGAIWQRGILEKKIDFLETKTLLVVGIGLVMGAGNLTFEILDTEISGIVSATFATIALNLVLRDGTRN